MQIRKFLSSLLHRFAGWVYYGDAAPHVDAVQHFIDRGLRPSNACPEAYPESDPLEVLGDELADARALTRKWGELRQRVVDELRREQRDLMPVHLRVIEESGLVNDENVYDRFFDRWESDVKWAADLFGEDPTELLRELQDMRQPKRTFGTFIAEVGPDFKGLKPDKS